MRSKNPELMVQIMEYIDDYYSKHCSSPSVRTIAAGVGTSKSTVQRYLVAMNEDGMLSYDGKELIIDKIRKTNKSTVNVAVVGSIACGISNLAEENIEEYVSLPKSMFGEGEFIILRANGESMVDAEIETGDLVVIRKQSCAEDGQIVVALVDDEATLKRLYRDNEKIRLHPENKDMDDIIADDCIIQGVAVKVIKDIH